MGGKQFAQIREGLQLENFQTGYGMTEASGGISCTGYRAGEIPVSDSVGKAAEGIELKIEREDGRMCTHPAGEILVRGPGVMQGYYREPEETRRMIDTEGWLHTGDLGYLGEDGTLHLTGRKKEIMICNGEKISPREIEEGIINYPGIAEVKVFGIGAADGEEEAAACVRMAEGEKFDEGSLRRYLAGFLAYGKIPKYFAVLDAFPVTANGKIDQKELEMAIRRWYEKRGCENGCVEAV